MRNISLSSLSINFATQKLLNINKEKFPCKHYFLAFYSDSVQKTKRFEYLQLYSKNKFNFNRIKSM